MDIEKLKEIREAFQSTDDFYEGNYEIGQFMKVCIEMLNEIINHQTSSDKIIVDISKQLSKVEIVVFNK